MEILKFLGEKRNSNTFFVLGDLTPPVEGSGSCLYDDVAANR